MYAMGLCGLLLAGLVALGAALGLFSAGPDPAARLTAEHYSQARAVVLRAVQDGARRAPGLAAGTAVVAGLSASECAAPWTMATDCDIPLSVPGVTAFAPYGWTPPALPDGSARWTARLSNGKLWVYGPADAKEMAAIQTAARQSHGIAWCPAGSVNGQDCTPQLNVALPSGIPGSTTATVVAVTELDFPTVP